MKPWVRTFLWVLSATSAAALVAWIPRAALIVPLIGIGLLAWHFPQLVAGCSAILILVVRPSLDVFSTRSFGASATAFNPAAVFGLTVLWIAVVLATRRLKEGKWLWPDRTIRWAHYWLFAAYIIGVISGARLYGLNGLAVGSRELIRVASIVGAFLVMLWWLSETATPVLGWLCLFAGAVAPIALALWQLVAGTGNMETEGVNRIQGTLSHPNSFGVYLVPFVLFLVGAIPSVRGPRRWACIAGTVGLSALVVLTYSRTALLVLVVALGAVPLLQATRLNTRTILASVALAVVVVGVSWFALGGLVRERFSDVSFGRDALEAAAAGESENSFTWRLINWSLLVGLGMEHPVMGTGAGMTTVLNPIVSPENGIPFNAHNDYVRFFFEGGFTGLVCYLMYSALLCIWALVRARRMTGTGASVGYGIAGALLTLMFLALGTPELSLNTVILYQLYAMLALLCFGNRFALRTRPEADYTLATGPQPS